MKLQFCSLFLLTCFLFSACNKVEKDADNYYPSVSTVSATVMPDGSVLVTGQILKVGSTAISACGFCMDTIPYPDMMTNQMLAATWTGNVFSASFTSFDQFKKYYFRAWAVNANGYAIGVPIALSNISFDTSQITCHPTTGQLDLSVSSATDNENFIYYDPLTQGTFDWSVSGHTNTHQLTITFAIRPVSGIYQVTSAADPVGYSAIVVLDGYTANSGGNIYVQEIDPKTIDITLCSLKVPGAFGTWSMSSKFRCTY